MSGPCVTLSWGKANLHVSRVNCRSYCRPALLSTHRLTTQRDVSAPEKRPALPPYCCAVLSRSVSDCATPWTVAHQAPLSNTILQPRRLEWVAMPSSKDSSQPRDRTRVSPSKGGFFTLSHQRSPRSR